jgi:hypothetical protein
VIDPTYRVVILSGGAVFAPESKDLARLNKLLKNSNRAARRTEVRLAEVNEIRAYRHG